MSQQTKHLKQLVGEVVSTAAQDTVVISLPVVKLHPLYRKRHTQHRRFYAHVDSDARYELGDMVKIQQIRPISKTKKWKVIEKVS